MLTAWPSQLAPSLPWRGRRLDVASRLDVLLVPFLGAALAVRVLDRRPVVTGQSPFRQPEPFGAIAVVFILLAIVLLLNRRHDVVPAALAGLWLCIWTAVAVKNTGATGETLREGVREGSVVALAVIVCNARNVMSVPVVTRIVQLAGVVPAVLALYQLATHTGADIAGEIRANGTFAHPDSAAMFFAIATVASFWRYLDTGRRLSDTLFTLPLRDSAGRYVQSRRPRDAHRDAGRVGSVAPGVVPQQTWRPLSRR